MTRRGENSELTPNLDRLYEMAAPQAGYFTTGQADEAGYSGFMIHYYVKKNRFEHVARGIYRLTHFPPTDHEDFVPPWLWSEFEGVYSHDSALQLHNLSDALPPMKRLTLPGPWKRRRLKAPPGVLLHYADIPASDRSWVGPVPVTTPLRTVVDCVEVQTPPRLIKQAVEEALDRGLFQLVDLREAIPAEAFRQFAPEVKRRRRRGG